MPRKQENDALCVSEYETCGGHASAVMWNIDDGCLSLLALLLGIFAIQVLFLQRHIQGVAAWLWLQCLSSSFLLLCSPICYLVFWN